MSVLTYGEITISNLTEPYTIELTKEAHIFNTSASRKVPTLQTCYTDVVVYQGASEYSDFTIGNISSANGITVSKSNHRITFTVNANTTLSADSGDFMIPIVINGETYYKVFTWSCSKQGETGLGGTGYTVVLSNESHIFKGNTTSAIGESVVTNIKAYKNATVASATITKIGSTTISGNQTNVNTGITGLTAKVLGNSTTSASVTFTATSALTAANGSIDITINVDGSLFTKTFSFSLSLIGEDGKDAKNINITCTSQFFTSFDNGDNYSPSSIQLVPTFQGGLSFGNWQYSLNGNTWTTITSSTNGMTLSSSTLTVSAKSTLFTTEMNSITFRCNSNDTNYYDTITLSRLFDYKNQFISIEEEINSISFEVDKQAQEIAGKVSSDTFSNTISILETDIEKASEGLDRWLIEIYPKTLFDSDEQSKYVLDVFGAKGLMPSRIETVKDSELKVGFNYTNNYIGYGLTFVYFSAAYNYTGKFLHSQAASLYLNGSLIKSDSSAVTSTNVSVTLNFKTGWNCLEVVWNDATSSEGFMLSPALSTLTQCEKINCRYASITGRSNQNINKTAELILDLDGITSRVSSTEQRITQNDGKISELNNQYSSLQQNLNGFKTEVEQAYASKEELSGTETSLNNYIKTVAEQTADKFSWLIDSGTNETNFTLTDRAATLVSDYINLNGLVTFSGLSSSAKSQITDDINTAVDEVKENAAYDIEVQYALGTSNTTAPNSGWSTTAPAWQEGKYMWQRTVTTYGNDSSKTSNATCISGANGKGIKSTAVTYQASTNGTIAPTGNWSSNIPSVSAGQYLWTRTIITYSDNSTSTSYSVGRSGTNGTNGTSVSISSTSVTYQASSSGTTTPTGNWSTSIPSVSAGQYLWTKTVVTYSNGTSTTSYSVGRNGTNGQDGTSVTVSSTKTEYQSGTSGMSQPTGSWSTSIPTVSAGNYLWTRVTTTYSDGKSAVSYSVARQGTNGTNGTSPTVSSTKIEYQQSTSGTTTPTGAWATTPPTATAGQYMWTRTTITYSDSKTAVSYSVSRNGANGAKGDTGVSVKSVTPLYYCSNSTSVPAKPTSTVTTNSATSYNTWNKTCPTWTATYKYYYICSEILYDNNAHTWSDVVADNGLTTANSTANTAKTTADTANNTLNTNKSKWDSAYSWTNTNGSSQISLLNMVKTWTDGAISNTTEINGGKLKTGTVTASKMAVGDFTNYVIDPTFELGFYQNSGSFSIDSTVKHSGSKSMKMAAGATSNTEFKLNDYKSFPILAGESFYVEWWGYRDNANQPARISIRIRNSAGDILTHDLSASYNMTTTATNQTWVKYSCELTSTYTGYGEICFKLATANTLTGNWYIDDVVVRRMASGEMIVDGAITADKLATDAIKSRNYTYSSGTFSSAGTFLDLTNGMFRSKNFAIDTSGNAFFNGEITANSGNIYLGKDGFKLYDKLEYKVSDGTLTINASTATVDGDNIATENYSDRNNLLIGSGDYKKDSTILWEGIGWNFTPDENYLRLQMDTETTETELDDWGVISIYKGLEVGKTYTLSVGLRSNMTSFSIYVADGVEGDEGVQSANLYTFTNVTTAWKEYKTITFTATKAWKYMFFSRSDFSTDGYIDIRYMMLEQGNKATQWIPCSYDPEAVTNYLNTDLNDQTASLGESIDSLTEKTQHTDEQIEEIISEDGIIYQTVAASKEELDNKIVSALNGISSVQAELYDYQNIVSRYMTFSNMGLIIGMEDSTFTSRWTETELGFYNDANKLSWLSGNEMHIKEAVIEETLNIGNVVLKKRGNGNVSFVWKN